MDYYIAVSYLSKQVTAKTLKALYTSPPGRHVHSDTNSTSLGGIHPCCSYCANTIHSHSHHYCEVVFMKLSDLGHWGETKNALASKRQQRGFAPGISQFRVCRSTDVLPCYSAQMNSCNRDKKSINFGKCSVGF